MKYVAAAIILAFVSGPAAAQAFRETSSGERYLMSDNEHGYVLTAPNETIYLGRSCDAFSTTSGTGYWDWANGGFCVSLSEKSICFPRQDVGAGQIDHDIFQCRM